MGQTAPANYRSLYVSAVTAAFVSNSFFHLFVTRKVHDLISYSFWL